MSSASATPRKRAPRKTTNPIVESVVDEPSADTDGTADIPPAPTPSDAGEQRIAHLRQMLIEEGLDPDEILSGTPINKPLDEVQAETEDENSLTNAMVDFHGRRIEVTAPQIEQVMVIRRMQSLFANAATMETITADHAIRLMDRALKAVCSVVVNPDDIEFIEDLLLTRQANMEDTLPLLRESLEALKRVNAAKGNRAERRSAAKSAGKSGTAALDTAGA